MSLKSVTKILRDTELVVEPIPGIQKMVVKSTTKGRLLQVAMSKKILMKLVSMDLQPEELSGWHPLKVVPGRVNHARMNANDPLFVDFY